MADWSLPTLTSTYANFLSNLAARDVDAATQFSTGTITNFPTGAIKWDTTNKRWFTWTGSAWAELTTNYNLTGVTCTSLNNTGNTTLGDSAADIVTVYANTWNFASGVTISGAVNFSTAIPVASGGTGATSAAAARANLGAAAFDGTFQTGRITIANTTASADVFNGGVELREVNGVGASQSSNTYAPALTFHWSSVVAAQMYLGSNGQFYFGSQGDKINSYRDVNVATVRSTGDLRTTGSLYVSTANTTGGGIILSDDGDIVDLNDTYCSMRFTGGVRVFSGNRTGSVVITLGANGDVLATGNVQAYSDERLKTNWRDLDHGVVDKLADLKSGVFDRIDNGSTQVGVGAQSLQAILPEAVSADENGTLSVAYGNAALALCVELAKEVRALKAEIAALKGE